MMILAISLLPSVNAKGGGGGVSNLAHCGAYYVRYCNGIAGDVQATGNSVGIKQEYGVYLPFHVADQINGWIKGRGDSWAQIGFVKGYVLDPSMQIHLYVECMYLPTQYSFSPYSDPGALKEVVSADSWRNLELRCYPQVAPDAIVFYSNGENKQTCYIESNYPYLGGELYGAAELTTTRGSMDGDWENMKYIIRTGHGGAVYLYFDWPSSTPFYYFDPYYYPPYHCVIDSANSFHNEYGW